jgi:hypothetical protein
MLEKCVISPIAREAMATRPRSSGVRIRAIMTMLTKPIPRRLQRCAKAHADPLRRSLLASEDGPQSVNATTAGFSQSDLPVISAVNRTGSRPGGRCANCVSTSSTRSRPCCGVLIGLVAHQRGLHATVSPSEPAQAANHRSGAGAPCPAYAVAGRCGIGPDHDGPPSSRECFTAAYWRVCPRSQRRNIRSLRADCFATGRTAD